jgi:hypothetical protein
MLLLHFTPHPLPWTGPRPPGVRVGRDTSRGREAGNGKAKGKVWKLLGPSLLSFLLP